MVLGGKEGRGREGGKVGAKKEEREGEKEI